MSRSFAIIPAAGRSTRMGRPKLLLEIAGQPLIRRTLSAWKQTGVELVLVVVRADDEPLLRAVCEGGAEPVVAHLPPPDMKASICLGLAYIGAKYSPTAHDAWLVAPADMPGLSPHIISALLSAAAANPRRVLIPTLAGRRGHPVLLPWSLANEVPLLGDEEGLNSLIDRHDPLLVPCDSGESEPLAAFVDIDTPDDLARFRPAN